MANILGKDMEEKKISLWLIEQNLMLYARQMLFLAILLDDAKEDSERAQIMLEIFGNINIRPSTAKYVRSKVSKLIDIVGNEASREEGQPNELR